MEGKELTNMGHLWSKFLTQVSNQGFSVMLLVMVVIYFSMQNDSLQQKVDACTQTRIQYYETQMSYLQTVIQENTRALDRNSRAITKAGGDP